MKSINRKVVSRLHSNQEIIGMLHAVKEEDNCSKLQFTFTIEIDLPSSKISNESLSLLIGKKIGVLNLDEEFFIREIKE